MIFILKTTHKSFKYWGWYVDEEEPIDIYREEVNFEKICPYAPPRPIMTIYPDKEAVVYWLSKHATRPKTSNYVLINKETEKKYNVFVIKLERRK